MRRLFFSFLIFVFCEQAEAVSLREALSEALNNNSAIKAARSKYESAKNRVPQAGALDDPWLTYDYEKVMGEGVKSFMVSQEVPFPTKLILRGKVSDSEAKSRFEEYKEKEKDILKKVKSEYAELYLAYKMIEINNENMLLLEQLADSAAARFSLGQTGQQDALRAQVELAKINNNIVKWEQKKQARQAMLNILLNHNPEENINEPVLEKNINIMKSIEELYSKAKENRPELRMWMHLIDKARNSLSLSRQEYLPDFMFSYENMTDSDDWEGMIGITLPIWFWQKQSYMVKEMEAELSMAEYDYKNMENMVMADIKNIYSQVTANQKLAELYETSFMPQAEQSLKANLTSYTAGQVDFLSLLDSQRMLLDFKMEYYDVLVNLEIAIAELEKAVGVDLAEE